MRRQTLQLLIALCVFGVSAVSCGSKEEEIQKSKRYVKVKRLGKKQNSEDLVFYGQLKEKKEVDVAFKVRGQVINLLVDEGDYVKQGQVIARIDPRDYKINLQSAQAQFKQIEGEYARYQELYKKKKLPVNTLEKMEAGYYAAKSGFEAAKNALEDTELRAPFDGFVYRKKISKFENVNPGQTIISVLDVSHLEVHFSLPESKISLAKNFGQVTIDIANANVYGVPAKVLSVNEKANGNDMFDVRLVIDNSNAGVLKPGMSAKVNIKVPLAVADAVTVPVEAVFTKAGKTYVWVYNKNNSCVKMREVVVKGFENNGLISVVSGLKGDEIVVTAGVHSLTNNQEVKLLANS